MKAVCHSLALLAASVVMTGVAQAEDKVSLMREVVPATNSIASITLEMKTEPMLGLGSGTQFSGLFVDLVRPQATWAMLDPVVPVNALPGSIPPSMLPIKAPRPINDPAVNEPDFAVLRFTFR